MSGVSSSTDNPLRVLDWSTVDLPIDWRGHMGSRGLLVALIHGTWCPFCVEQLIWLQRRNEWLSGLGIHTLALVVDDPSHVLAFNSSLAHPLPYTLLADVDGRFSKALGLYDSENHYARSAVLVLDQSGHVRFTHFEPHSMPEQSALQRVIEQLSVA
jgi:peroxiredoxin